MNFLRNKKVYEVVKSNIFGTVYIYIVLLLWSIAIWDISGIVKDFFTENLYTFVRRVDVKNNTAPFVEDAEICISYNTNIFGQIWWNDSEVKDILDEVDSWPPRKEKFQNWTKSLRYLQEKEFSINENGTVLLTRAELIYVASIMDKIYEMEFGFPPKPNVDFYNKYPMDVFLNNSQAELLAKTVHKWMESHTYTLLPFVGLRSFYSSRICSYIQTRYILNGSYPSVDEKFSALNTHIELPVGIVWSYENGKKVSAPFESKVGVVYLRLPYQEHVLSNIPAGGSGIFMIEISNVGMYDQSGVSTDCVSNGEITQLGNGDCKKVLYNKAIKMFCKCVPFSPIIRNVGRGDGLDDEIKTFCPTEIYNSTCMKNVADFVSTGACPESCLTTKNKYVISKVVNNGLYWASPPGITEYKYTRIGIVFTMADNVYSVYEEKYKMSIAQLVAQVGGDLGLYTGFSMLALWQFMSFLFTHERRRHLTVQKNPANPPHTESWFRVFLCHITDKCGESKTREREQRERDEKEEKFKKDVEIRFSKIENQILTMCKEQKSILDEQKSIADLIQKVLLQIENLDRNNNNSNV